MFDEVVEIHLQLAIEEVSVNTIVLLGSRFPRHIWITFLCLVGTRSDRASATEEETTVSSIIYIRQIEETRIIAHTVVTYDTVRDTHLQVVHKVLYRLHELLFGHNPTYRKCRKQTETLAGSKVLRTVVAHVYIKQVAGVIVIGSASHQTDITSRNRQECRRTAGIVGNGLIIHHKSRNVVLAEVALIVQSSFHIPVFATADSLFVP